MDVTASTSIAVAPIDIITTQRPRRQYRSSQLNTTFWHTGSVYRPFCSKYTSKYPHQSGDNQWPLDLNDIRMFLWISIIFSLLWSGSINATLLDTSVACDQANFMLTLNFDTPFHGLVYSEEGFPNCVYVNGTMLSHSSYQLKIPLTGCETRINGEGNYENAIIIQENDAFLQSTDKKYLLTCIPSTPITPAALPTQSPLFLPSTTIVEAITSLTVATKQPPANNFINANSDATTQATDKNVMSIDIGGNTTPVENSSEHRDAAVESIATNEKRDADTSLKYSVEIRNGHELNAPPLRAALNIGDPIAYMVRLQKPVADSQVGRCWASDSRSSLELSDERGCSLQPRAHIWGAFERAETAREIIFINRIKAWAFPTSNEVNIFCNLRICLSRACSFGNCTAINFRSSTADNVNEPTAKRQKFYDNNSRESIANENRSPTTSRQRPQLQHFNGEGAGLSDHIDILDPEKSLSFWRDRVRRHDSAVLVPVKTRAAPTSAINTLPDLVPLNPSRPIQPINRRVLDNPIQPVGTSPKHLVTKNVIAAAKSSTTNQLPPTPTVVLFGGRVGELTEIETLATHLRFRRQSIQHARISDTSLITVNDNENGTNLPSLNAKELPAFIEWQHHRESPVIIPGEAIINSDNIAPRSQFREIDDFRTALPDPPLTPAPPHETFSPTAWRIAAVSAFLALFSIAFVAFFVLWPPRTFPCRPSRNMPSGTCVGHIN